MRACVHTGAGVLAPALPLISAACLIAFLAVWLAACPGVPANRAGDTGRARPGAGPRLSPRKAVELELRTVEGELLRLSSFRGKPLVLLFFATWCVPCQVQLARLQPVRAALGNHRVAVVGVALDRQRRLVPTFVEAAGIDFPVVYGDPSMVRSSPLGPVRGVPRTLILDARGRPRADFHRPVDSQVLMKALRPLVRRAEEKR
jgi:thiol-disulfide isomerase/thioredoxin